MSVYHQMGHHSANLLRQPELELFSGAILSPVNYKETEVISQVDSAKQKTNFKTIFDPQLYSPTSERGILPQWSYFPRDVDTTDLNSTEWWYQVIDSIVETCQRVNPTSACSPIIAPKVFNPAYYSTTINHGNYFFDSLQSTSIEPIQTVICSMSDLSQPGRPYEIASIISKTKSNVIYLIFKSETVPRREISNTDEIKSAMLLISTLENAGLQVIVGYCSTDFVLWKAAGAKICASGKFFNLRRFTSSRFEEPAEGGGQLPYWFEESLVAFLRESDILRVREKGLISHASLENPFGQEILNLLDNNPGEAWLAISWRQYLYAFASLEQRIEKKEVHVNDLLLSAEKLWLYLDDNNVLMEEMRNNGEWIRIWRRAVVEFASSQ